jgi:uncharacterized membrane protein
LAEDPYFGGQRSAETPARGFDIYPNDFGYVQTIDGATLGAVSDDLDGKVHLLVGVGDWIDPSRPLLRCQTKPDVPQAERLRAAFSIGTDRLFEDDPVYGLVVLAEVAVRALSSGENDPGTALDVIATSVRVLAHWSDTLDDIPKVRHPNLYVRGADLHVVFDEAFRWVARDGAAQLEVQLRLQDGLAALAMHDPQRFGQPARHVAAEAMERSRLAMTHKPDVGRLRQNAERLGLADGE